jgi:hypothetical protein
MIGPLRIDGDKDHVQAFLVCGFFQKKKSGREASQEDEH